MDLKSLFDSVYDKLVLRDLFGKVVPGTLFIFAVTLSSVDLELMPGLLGKMTFPVWMVVFGFAWLTAFALQYVGEITRLLKKHPPGTDGKETRQSFYLKWAKFQTIAQDHERLHAERLNVIRKSCGNAAISLALVALIAIWKLHTADSPSPIIDIRLITLIVGIAFCLWRMHVKHVKRYGALVENTISFRDADAQEKTGESKGSAQ